MDEYQWLEIRAETLKSYKEMLLNVFERAGLNIDGTMLAYKIKYATSDTPGVLTIYSNTPGIIIGKGGKRITLIKELMAEVFQKQYEVKLEEISGFYTNFTTSDNSNHSAVFELMK